MTSVRALRREQPPAAPALSPRQMAMVDADKFWDRFMAKLSPAGQAACLRGRAFTREQLANTAPNDTERRQHIAAASAYQSAAEGCLK